MKRLLLVFTIALIAQQSFGQQDPLITSYQFNQLPINPAYAGVNNVTSFDLHYRSQWGGVEGAPQAVFFSGTTSIIENKVGVGFSLLQDKSGIIKNTNFNINLAYALDLTNDIALSFGMQAGVLSLKYDYNVLNLEDATDEDFIGTSDDISKLNIGTGLFLSAEHFYLGVSIPRMLNITDDNSIGSSGERYNRHYYISAGFILEPLESIKIKPYTLIRIAENSPISIDLGANVLLMDMLWAGLFTRSFNSIGLSTSIGLHNGIRIGYLGELNATDAPASGFSTHEITLGFDVALFEKQTVGKRYY